MAGPDSVRPDHRIFLLDLETTGLDPRIDRIMEIAILRYEPFQSPECLCPYETLAKCEKTVSKKAFDVHGLTSSRTKNAPTFTEA